METLYRKVSVNERLPEKGKDVFAINKDGEMLAGNIYDHYSDFGMEYFCENDNESMEDITHWLEELPHPSSEGEIGTPRSIVDKNFKGLADVIKDKDILHWYEDLIVTCIEEYSRQHNKELIEALEELVHLHMCEQEGIVSGQPTPKQWLKAVDKASEAIHKHKQ